ncbi:hypothetical protein B0H63DRAFT_517260 [Podospora didyma]|uniref:EGF-like domain-containing protein n=1 Tax=Podospora didyma TaxID=330526 RepID=A0AAE0P685_9PEZI|nr:hypothetical protein B0H63DRAFT_517260 [Podospora didyma]
MLDGSKVQDHTPVFQYKPQSGRESTGLELVPETPSTLSRPSTLSSVVSIPDFPSIPAQPPALQLPPSRRSVNLGPPPSARRGASSFYSNASYVSPIPEESPRSRSRTSYASYASSAAIPENWGTDSPGPSPDYPDVYFDDTIVEEGPAAFDEDDAEESRLVRNASIGKRAKPTLVSSAIPRGLEGGDRTQRPGPAPIQFEPFRDGTGYLENSSSSSTLQTAKGATGSILTADAILNAYSSASATDPSRSSPDDTPSPQLPPGGRAFSRLSAIRRPPRLDMDAVKKAESRGSLTSLPDLIRRATRLAASLEKGRRPASRFDDLDGYSGQEDYGGERDASTFDGEKHRSGLSDMLAAFPPPAHPAVVSSRRSFRESVRDQVQSWPLPFNSNRTPNTSQEAMPGTESRNSGSKQGRRCCGLPLWGFIVIMIVVLLLIAAAVVIPVEFFVVRRQNANSGSQQALEDCQSRLVCANGGTNVINQGSCSCVCSNGFTGIDCTVAGSIGCTTILANGNNNVTVGDAIPRLIQQAQTNFSIPLSSSGILAKLNAGNLSCSAENALVTFDGQTTRQGAALALPAGVLGAANVVNGILMTTITIMVGDFTTFTLDAGTAALGKPTSAAASITRSAGNQPIAGTGFSTVISAPGTFVTTLSVGRPTTTSTVTTTMPMSSSPSGTLNPTATFSVTEEVLDFARVAVLYILQEESLSNAETAQVTLQRFFTDVTPGASASSSEVSVQSARNVTVGNGNSVNLVEFFIDTGDAGGRVGGTPAVKTRHFLGGALRYARSLH